MSSLSPSPETNRAVYQACKAIFASDNASIRKSKAIKGRLKRRQKALEYSIPNIDLNSVADICKDLLKKQVFQSEAKAKLEFPELFISGLTRQDQHAVSEQESLQPEAEARVRPTANCAEKGTEANTTIAFKPSHDNPHNFPATESGAPYDYASRLATERIVQIQPPYPSCLPYQAQHVILSTVQVVLEQCCFDFAKKWLPLEVAEYGWDCAEAAELTQWTKIIQKWSSKLPSDSVQLSDSSLRAALTATHKIRHTAVHRLPTRAAELSALIVRAMRMTNALQDPVRTYQLQCLHHDVLSKVELTERLKTSMEATFSRDMERIQLQRRGLDEKEKTMRIEAAQNVKKMRAMVQSFTQESVSQIFGGGEEKRSKGRRIDELCHNGGGSRKGSDFVLKLNCEGTGHESVAQVE